MSLVAGVDGCRGGWVCVVHDLNSHEIEGHILERIDDILQWEERPEVLAIDIPIGLPEVGPRICDLEARAYLGKPRSNSVFPAPIRPVLSTSSYEQACQLGQSIENRKLSKQLWGIIPKIREVDTFLRSDVTRNRWIREIHPEVCFWCWNKGQAMSHSKKKPEGRQEREALVVPNFGQAYSSLQKKLPQKKYANDDLLDAFAALWTAERVYNNQAMVIPSEPPVDSCGLRMEMVC